MQRSTFTDDDLKILKMWASGPNYDMGFEPLPPGKLRGLLARLEAAETAKSKMTCPNDYTMLNDCPCCIAERQWREITGRRPYEP